MIFDRLRGAAICRVALLSVITTSMLLGGCATVAPTEERPSAESSRPAATAPATPAGTPTASPSPTASTPTEASLELRCDGDTMRGGTIDYADEAPGTTDIVAATRALGGVLATDLVVRNDASTVVIRGGQAIWRGDWGDRGRGFLLDQWMSWEDAGIGA